MLELADDYLAAEPHLEALLNEVDGIRKVYLSADLAEMKERAQHTPAAHLIYGGDRMNLNAQGGNLNRVTQTWIVVLVIKLIEKDKAGVLLAKLIKKLSGVVSPLGPVNRVDAPAKPMFRGGFGYYPLAFEITFRTKGA